MSLGFNNYHPEEAAPMNGIKMFVDELDKTKSLQQGENHHCEYGYNHNDLKELLVQITFQSTRTGFVERFELGNRFSNWVENVVSGISLGEEIRNEMIELLNIGYKTIAHLRDITDGKGECRLAYTMLIGWFHGLTNQASKVSNDISQKIICFRDETTFAMARSFMFATDGSNSHQFGSFKDFKYLCHEYIIHQRAKKIGVRSVDTMFFKKFNSSDGGMGSRFGSTLFRFSQDEISHLTNDVPFINQLAIDFGVQIYKDWVALEEAKRTSKMDSLNISLAARWAPRRGSGLFGPLSALLVNRVVPESILWYSTIQMSIKPNVSQLVENKLYATYRKRLAILNRHLDTVQIKQCEGRWSEIDFDKGVTSVTLIKQRTSFLKEHINEDRRLCAVNFRTFIDSVSKREKTAKGKRVSIYAFVKQCLQGKTLEQSEKNLLDAQWDDKGKDISGLGDFIAMVDTSNSMTCLQNYPLYTAIGLGIRIAEKSKLGNRVMTFSQKPEWLNLDRINSFCDRVEKVRKADWGMNTNFAAALRMIIRAAELANLSASEVANLTLIILSDMQMDQADDFNETLYNELVREFADAGIRNSGEAWTIPKIVFWNLRSTSGFPSRSTNKNAIMLSGGSDILLNDLCEEGLSAIKNIQLWTMLVKLLNKERYEHISKNFSQLIDW